MYKKAQIQFNWIFILIAGVIFITFFTTIAIKYKSVQEEKTTLEVLNNLETAITSLQSSPFKTTLEINIPVKTEILCLNNNTYLEISKKRQITNNIISSTSLNKETVISSNQLSLPFKITTLYYIIPKTTKYVFVYQSKDNDKIQKIKEDLSLLGNIEFVASPLANQEPNKKYVFFYPNQGTSVNLEQQTINKLPYYSNEMLYSLIFSSQPECTFNTISNEINSKIELYKEKAKFLASTCDYSSILTKISQLKTNPSQETQESITNLNKQLINQNCPSLY